MNSIRQIYENLMIERTRCEENVLREVYRRYFGKEFEKTSNEGRRMSVISMEGVHNRKLINIDGVTVGAIDIDISYDSYRVSFIFNPEIKSLH